jgi:hypothetical protein
MFLFKQHLVENGTGQFCTDFRNTKRAFCRASERPASHQWRSTPVVQSEQGNEIPKVPKWALAIFYIIGVVVVVIVVAGYLGLHL